MRNILILGGGITGLTVLYELNKWRQASNADVRLMLAEASPKLGGKIQTVTEKGFIMETGADSIVSRKIENGGLLEELGLHTEQVYNSAGISYIYVDGELKQIPADAIFGIPTSIESLATTTLVSAEGKVAALQDFYVTDNPFTENDSIGDFLEYYFGKELVEKQIAPVLSGVYSGKLSELSIKSTMPYLLDYKNEFGSIIKGFSANKEKFKSGGSKKFLSFKNGLHTLIDGLVEHSKGAEIYTNWEAIRMEREQDKYQVTFANGEKIEADEVVLSIPHSSAQRLLQFDGLDTDFSHLQTSALISVYLGFAIPDERLPYDGTGFITANQEDLFCNACTWTSRKWEHTSNQGNLLVRMFYKNSNPRFSEIQQMNEQQLVKVALTDFEKSLGIKAEPMVHIVTDWTGKMPKYQINHAETITALVTKLSVNYPGVYLAGSSYYGVGVPDCIENGKEIAQKIIQSL
ncbi:protoporphyrinogen oxidase [Caldibacillus lycopersici]|uniref:Coproporphyrinogen III oxidase n=1 Tax=Perspicuibacillus lycopersici TaxID=1325689 RepID=A0AAE3LRB7_9BACI|nr:protoporphyrinogen oxidase [Perspicuibacillus lycopersici]MCU9614454.1 protoporphyrinogen oxidase [Perspicuibacillus lycopersici]